MAEVAEKARGLATANDPDAMRAGLVAIAELADAIGRQVRDPLPGDGDARRLRDPPARMDPIPQLTQSCSWWRR